MSRHRCTIRYTRITREDVSSITANATRLLGERPTSNREVILTGQRALEQRGGSGVPGITRSRPARPGIGGSRRGGSPVTQSSKIRWMLLAPNSTTPQTQTKIVGETRQCRIHGLDVPNSFLVDVIWAKPLLTAAALDHDILITGVVAVWHMTPRGNENRRPSIHSRYSFHQGESHSLFAIAKIMPIPAW
jgi:hypothetical protein